MKKSRKIVSITNAKLPDKLSEIPQEYFTESAHQGTLVEMVTQLAFYCGWPKAWSTFPMIEEVYNKEDVLQ